MNQQQFWNYFKISVRDYIFFSVLYGTLYCSWSLIFKGHIAHRMDIYDVYFWIAGTLLVLPLMAYGKYTCEEWLNKGSCN